MAQSNNNYPTGNGGVHPPAPSLAAANGQAAPGPVAVAAMMGQPQQQQQVNFLQHQSLFANQMQQQQPPQQPQQGQPPQTHQFMPGPFYTLQQQQAFAQARLAAAAQQQQEQLRQTQQQAQRQQQQQQQQQSQQSIPHPTNSQPQQQQHMYAGYPIGGQQQAVNTNAPAGGAVAQSTSPSTYHAAAAAAANATAGLAPVGAAVTVSTTGGTTTTPASALPPNRKRKSPESKGATKKSASPVHAPKVRVAQSPKKPASKPPLPPSAASLTSGMSATATKLIENAMAESNACDIPAAPASASPAAADGKKPMSAEEKLKSSRDRNREHARCTRLRKKAYVNKLKELVDGLHAERSEDARKRRVAVQHLAEIQELRRKVVHTFLEYHARFEKDVNKWKTILESDFWLKQPVTPYRSFPRCEIQKGSRILKGVDAMIRDSASMSVMIETIGSRNLRWLQRKRDDFLTRDAFKHASAGRTHRISHAGNTSGNSTMPHSIVRQNSRLQHAVSSLSSSSGSSTGNGSGSEEEQKMAQRRKTQGKLNSGSIVHAGHQTDDKKQTTSANGGAKKVSSSSSSNDTHKQLLHNQASSNDYHDYHAPSLEDPLPDSSGGSSPSSEGADIDSDNCVVGGKRMCTDSSSSEEDKAPKKQKTLGAASAASAPALKMDGGTPSQGAPMAQAASANMAQASTVSQPLSSGLPKNIAKSGGIFHDVKAVVNPPPIGATVPVSSSAASTSLPGGRANLSRAPVTALPPFAGIGKRKRPPTMSHSTNMSTDTGGVGNCNSSSSSSKPLSIAVPKPAPPVVHGNGSSHQNEETNNGSNLSSSRSASHHRGNIITIDNDTGTTSSQSSSQNQRGIQAHYHINEDDMILTDDVLMCPFIFRSQEAVWCGALAECVQPGMLRASFSPTNKLRNVEMIFDAMGFCQQLERASGNEGMAQIIPNSLEMALAPNSEEARVITLAKKPFRIVSVNEAWTAMTGYTQLDAEGKDLAMLDGERTDADAGMRPGMPLHDLESVSKGVCAASTKISYDINGKEFLNFMCSYPLSNLSNQVTHILHVCQELPARA